MSPHTPLARTRNACQHANSNQHSQSPLSVLCTVQRPVLSEGKLVGWVGKGVGVRSCTVGFDSLGHCRWVGKG